MLMLQLDARWEDDVGQKFGPFNAADFSIADLGNLTRKLQAESADIWNPVRVITAMVGDVIDHDSSADDTRLFVTNDYGYDRGKFPSFEYDALTPWSLYLGFESKYTDFSGNSETLKTIYSWVELRIDNNSVSLGDSCIDLTGRPVVVGVRSAEPIPEPASGALALLGAALLFRRRRAFSTIPIHM